MRRVETFPVDIPLRWTTWRYRALAQVRVRLQNFMEEAQARFHSLLAGSNRTKVVRL